MGELEGSSFSEENLKSAAMELLDQFECSTERAGDAAEAMLDVVANLALPETQPSLVGGQTDEETAVKGIKNTQQDADGLPDGKYMKNGKFIIIKEGKKYNAAGSYHE